MITSIKLYAFIQVSVWPWCIFKVKELWHWLFLFECELTECLLFLFSWKYEQESWQETGLRLFRPWSDIWVLWECKVLTVWLVCVRKGFWGSWDLHPIMSCLSKQGCQKATKSQSSLSTKLMFGPHTQKNNGEKTYAKSCFCQSLSRNSNQQQTLQGKQLRDSCNGSENENHFRSCDSGVLKGSI